MKRHFYLYKKTKVRERPGKLQTFRTQSLFNNGFPVIYHFVLKRLYAFKTQFISDSLKAHQLVVTRFARAQTFSRCVGSSTYAFQIALKGPLAVCGLLYWEYFDDERIPWGSLLILCNFFSLAYSSDFNDPEGEESFKSTQCIWNAIQEL